MLFVPRYARASPFEVHIYGLSEDLSGLGENPRGRDPYRARTLDEGIPTEREP